MAFVALRDDAHGRRGPLRPLAAAVRGRGGLLRRRRATRAGASPPCCSSTWPWPPGGPASARSPPRCCRPTSAWWRVFRKAGFELRSTFDEGVIEVHLDLQPTPEAEAAIEARAQRAEAEAVRLLLAPRSVAVIGAGRERGSVGHAVLRNLLAHEFDGPVYPVNPQADHVAGVPAVAGRRRHRGPGRPGRRGGAGGRGARGGRGLRPQGRQGGHRHLRRLRRVGPRGRGAVRGRAAGRPPLRHPAARAQLPGRHQHRPRGAAARHLRHPQTRARARWRCCRSRGRSAARSSTASATRGWGPRRSPPSATGPTCPPTTCSSTGPTTTAPSWCCSTSSRSATPASSAASPASCRAPSRSWRSRAGARPGPTRTRARRWPPGRLEALVEQTGIIRVDTLAEQLHVARLLACQPLPAGDRVALVGNGGGSLALAADACVDAGLALATLGPASRGARRRAPARRPPAGQHRRPRLRGRARRPGAGAGRPAGRRRRRQRAGGVRPGAPPVDRPTWWPPWPTPGRRAPGKTLLACVFGAASDHVLAGPGRPTCRCSTSPTTPPTRSAGSPATPAGGPRPRARWSPPEGRLAARPGAPRAWPVAWREGRDRAGCPPAAALDLLGAAGCPSCASPVAARRRRGGARPPPSWATRWRSRPLAAPGRPRPRPAGWRSTSTTRPSCGPARPHGGALGDGAWPVVVQPMVEPGVDVAVAVPSTPLVGPGAHARARRRGHRRRGRPGARAAAHRRRGPPLRRRPAVAGLLDDAGAGRAWRTCCCGWARWSRRCPSHRPGAEPGDRVARRGRSRRRPAAGGAGRPRPAAAGPPPVTAPASRPVQARCERGARGAGRGCARPGCCAGSGWCRP